MALRIARAAYPGREVNLWFEDEGRAGLKPLLKRLWALRGERPTINQIRKYQWLYTYIFVEPKTGNCDFMLLPTVNIAWMSEALAKFVERIDPLGKKIIVLVVDQAGWHMSKKLKVPGNILIVPQPAYTPELSPVEPMVKKLHAPLCNKLITKISEVRDLVATECRRLEGSKKEVKSQTLFPWLRRVIESF